MKTNSISHREKTLIRNSAYILAGLASFFVLPLLIFASVSPGQGALAFCSPLYRYLFRSTGALAGVLNSVSAIAVPVAALVLLIGAYFLSRRAAGKRGLLFLPAGLALAMAGYESASRRYVTIGALLLLAALATAGYASATSFRRIVGRPGGTRRWYRLGLALILLIAAVNCCYQLEYIPYRLSGWEVSGGISAIQLSGGIEPDYPKLLWSSLDRPYNGAPSSPFFVYPLAIMIKLFGVSILTIRSAGVFWGLLSLLILYFLVENLFEQRSALLATFFTSISPWFLSIARLGNYISISLCYVLAVLLFFAWAIKGKLSAFLVAGLLLSFFSYFYLPVKMLFPALGLIWLHYALVNPAPFRSKAAGFLCFIIGFFIFQALIGNPFPRLSGVALPNAYLGSSPGLPGFSISAALADLQRNLYSLFYRLFYPSYTFEFPAPRGLLFNRTVLLLGLLGFGWSAVRWRNGSSFFISIASLMALLPILLTAPGFSADNITRRGFLLAAFIPTLAAIAVNSLAITGSLLWARKRPLLGKALIGLFLLITGAFSVTEYFQAPAHPYFSIKRYFAEQCVRLSRQGYYLEIGESDYHLQELVDFLSFPHTQQLYTYYPYMGAQFTHRGRISDLTYYRSIGENPFYHFWTGGDFNEMLTGIRKSGRKTAILYEVEVAGRYRPFLAEIANAYPEAGAAITELKDPENRIIGFQALLEGR